MDGDLTVVYCLESLPRLKSVHVSFLTNCPDISLQKDSLKVTRRVSCEELECAFGSCKLDLASLSHMKLADGILSLKFGTSPPFNAPPNPPPGDPLGRGTFEPSQLSLVCGFCNSTLTTPQKYVRGKYPDSLYQHPLLLYFALLLARSRGSSPFPRIHGTSSVGGCSAITTTTIKAKMAVVVAARRMPP